MEQPQMGKSFMFSYKMVWKLSVDPSYCPNLLDYGDQDVTSRMTVITTHSDNGTDGWDREKIYIQVTEMINLLEQGVWKDGVGNREERNKSNK